MQKQRAPHDAEHRDHEGYAREGRGADAGYQPVVQQIGAGRAYDGQHQRRQPVRRRWYLHGPQPQADRCHEHGGGQHAACGRQHGRCSGEAALAEMRRTGVAGGAGQSGEHRPAAAAGTEVEMIKRQQRHACKAERESHHALPAQAMAPPQGVNRHRKQRHSRSEDRGVARLQAYRRKGQQREWNRRVQCAQQHQPTEVRAYQAAHRRAQQPGQEKNRGAGQSHQHQRHRAEGRRGDAHEHVRGAPYRRQRHEAQQVSGPHLWLKPVAARDWGGAGPLGMKIHSSR